MASTDAPHPRPSPAPARIRTVLCPVDFSALSDRELRVAIEICETFSAKLVLHHNLGGAPPLLSKSWEWEESHPEAHTDADAEAHLRELLARIPETVAVEARLTRGPVATALLCLAGQLPADLLILGCHGETTEEHVSVTERIIDQCPCPVLTIREGRGESHPFLLHARDEGGTVQVVVPTDFSDSANHAVSYAFSLARVLPLEIHLVHVPEPAARAAGDPSAASRRQLEDLVPLDLLGKVRCHVEPGHAADKIVELTERLDPELVVMGRHAHGFFRRFFTRDTSRELLHRATCPVWYVAAGAA